MRSSLNSTLLVLLVFAFAISCKSDDKDHGADALNQETIKTHGDPSNEYVLSQGDSIFVRTVGSGPPILIIHGGPGMDHSYLLPHMDALADSYQLVYYDQRASGRSQIDVDSTTVSMQGFLTDMESIRKHYNFDRWHVMGHSWGGLLGMCYALEHEDRLQSLLLINSTAASTELQEQEQELLVQRESEEDRKAREAIIQSPAFQNGETSAYEELYRLIFTQEFYDKSYIDSLVLDFQPDFASSGAKLRFLSKDFSDVDLNERLQEMKVPTLILYGAHDVQSTTSGPSLARQIPENEFVVLEKSGHFPFVESKEDFFTTVRTFLMSANQNINL